MRWTMQDILLAHPAPDDATLVGNNERDTYIVIEDASPKPSAPSSPRPSLAVVARVHPQEVGKVREGSFDSLLQQ